MLPPMRFGLPPSRMSCRDCCREIGDCYGACCHGSVLGFHCACRRCLRDHDGQGGRSIATLIVAGFSVWRKYNPPVSAQDDDAQDDDEAPCDRKYRPKLILCSNVRWAIFSKPIAGQAKRCGGLQKSLSVQ